MPVLLLALLASSPGNLLSSAHGVADARLVDGEVAFEGDEWLSASAVELRGPIDFDLGETRTFSAAAIQADHNDEYVISVSNDREHWADVFFAAPVDETGLRQRVMRGGTVTGRYLRLRGEHGDGHFSVSEVEVFETPEALKSGSAMPHFRWLPEHPLDRTWLSLGVLSIFALALARVTKAGRFIMPLVVVAAAFVCWQTFASGPQTQERIVFIRATLASIAFAAVLLEPETRSRWFLAVLAFCGVLALACFLNLGRAQFHDAGKNKPTFLHHYDMRTYFPIAKYFNELRFDGVYAASVAAVADDGAGGLDAMANIVLRDLKDHEIRTVRDSRASIEEVRGRFSPERWAELKTDMRYFRDAMTDGGFLGSMSDHGGNATPVWFLAARLLMGFSPASDSTLWRGVIADAVLMLLAFAALWWAYGPRVAFIAMTVFGTMDFYMFGTNWFGAALRHDWLALWCLAIAMLKRHHFALAGALLMWAALIRAFPALAFVTLAAPLVWLLAKPASGGSSSAGPSLHEAPLRGVLVGAGVWGSVLFISSSLMFGFDSWLEWLHKVSMLNAAGHVNNIAIKTYVVPQHVAWVVTCIIVLGAVLFSLRDAALDQAAAFGTALIGIVFNPANYYLHCLFVLAVLERRVQKLALIAMCIACFYANRTTALSVHFERETWAMVFALFVILAAQLAGSHRPAAAR